MRMMMIIIIIITDICGFVANDGRLYVVSAIINYVFSSRVFHSSIMKIQVARTAKYSKSFVCFPLLLLPDLFGIGSCLYS